LGLTLDRENMLGSAPPRKFPKSSTEKSEVPMEMEIIQQEVLGEVQLANEKSVMPPSPSPTQWRHSMRADDLDNLLEIYA